jgi:pyrroline-5-carboxylate reductase
LQKIVVGFLGAGNMANAIIRGIQNSTLSSQYTIMVYDIDVTKCEKMARQGVAVAESALSLVEGCSIVFLAVKPQNYGDLLEEIREVATVDQTFVSIAAGISTVYIQQVLGKPCPVVRAMPNTPLLLGQGATALCPNHVSEAAFQQVCEIFRASGLVEILPEHLMNAVISVNGSSPAYVYLMVKTMVDHAVSYGIDEKTALRLVCQTFVGSASMLLESGSTPDELIQTVSSPGGTTLRALDALREDGFCAALEDAMDRCTRRAEELGR